MRIFWTLLRRELSVYFVSIAGYVIIAAVTFLSGLIFKVLMDRLGSAPFPMPVTELFFNTLWFWIILPLVAPVITMRLFALEKFSGTFETLMTAPVSDVQVVAAKFSAALVFYMVMWLPLLGGLFIVQHFTNQPGTLNLGTIGGMYLGLFSVGCLFISIGCFTSSLTRSQMIAAMISLVFGIGLLLISYLAEQIPAHDWESQVLSFFNLPDQIHDFLRGVVDTRAVIFYASLTLFFLFLTLRAVESRRWK
jgi:ABC-2 type transport system permease protein